MDPAMLAAYASQLSTGRGANLGSLLPQQQQQQPSTAFRVISQNGSSTPVLSTTPGVPPAPTTSGAGYVIGGGAAMQSHQQQAAALQAILNDPAMIAQAQQQLILQARFASMAANQQQMAQIASLLNPNTLALQNAILQQTGFSPYQVLQQTEVPATATPQQPVAVKPTGINLYVQQPQQQQQHVSALVHHHHVPGQVASTSMAPVTGMSMLHQQQVAHPSPRPAEATLRQPSMAAGVPQHPQQPPMYHQTGGLAPLLHQQQQPSVSGIPPEALANYSVVAKNPKFDLFRRQSAPDVVGRMGMLQQQDKNGRSVIKQASAGLLPTSAMLLAAQRNQLLNASSGSTLSTVSLAISDHSEGQSSSSLSSPEAFEKHISRLISNNDEVLSSHPVLPRKRNSRTLGATLAELSPSGSSMSGSGSAKLVRSGSMIDANSVNHFQQSYQQQQQQHLPLTATPSAPVLPATQMSPLKGLASTSSTNAGSPSLSAAMSMIQATLAMSTQPSASTFKCPYCRNAFPSAELLRCHEHRCAMKETADAANSLLMLGGGATASSSMAPGLVAPKSEIAPSVSHNQLALKRSSNCAIETMAGWSGPLKKRILKNAEADAEAARRDVTPPAVLVVAPPPPGAGATTQYTGGQQSQVVNMLPGTAVIAQAPRMVPANGMSSSSSSAAPTMLLPIGVNGGFILAGLQPPLQSGPLLPLLVYQAPAGASAAHTQAALPPAVAVFPPLFKSSDVITPLIPYSDITLRPRMVASKLMQANPSGKKRQITLITHVCATKKLIPQPVLLPERSSNRSVYDYVRLGGATAPSGLEELVKIRSNTLSQRKSVHHYTTAPSSKKHLVSIVDSREHLKRRQPAAPPADQPTTSSTGAPPLAKPTPEKASSSGAVAAACLLPSQLKRQEFAKRHHSHTAFQQVDVRARKKEVKLDEESMTPPMAAALRPPAISPRSVLAAHRTRNQAVIDHLSARFRCERCELKFTTRPMLMRHMRSHYTAANWLPSADSQSQIIFDCPVCMVVFKNRVTLSRHLKTKSHQRALAKMPGPSSEVETTGTNNNEEDSTETESETESAGIPTAAYRKTSPVPATRCASVDVLMQLDMTSSDVTLDESRNCTSVNPALLGASTSKLLAVAAVSLKSMEPLNIRISPDCNEKPPALLEKPKNGLIMPRVPVPQPVKPEAVPATAKTNVPFLTQRKEKPTCNICGQQFTTDGLLHSHLYTHSYCDQTGRRQDNKCIQCGQTFRTKPMLQAHVAAIHTTPVKQDAAGQAGGSGDIVIDVEQGGSVVPIGSRKFDCTLCDVSFRLPGHLVKHLRCKKHFEVIESKWETLKGLFNMANEKGCISMLNALDAQKCSDPERAHRLAMDLTGRMAKELGYDFTVVEPSQHLAEDGTGEDSNQSTACESTGRTVLVPTGVATGCEYVDVEMEDVDVEAEDDDDDGDNYDDSLTSKLVIVETPATPEGNSLDGISDRLSVEPQILLSVDTPPRPMSNLKQHQQSDSQVSPVTVVQDPTVLQLSPRSPGRINRPPLIRMASTCVPVSGGGSSSAIVAADVWTPPTTSRIYEVYTQSTGQGCPVERGLAEKTGLPSVPLSTGSTASTSSVPTGPQEASPQQVSPTKCGFCNVEFPNSVELDVHLHTDHIQMRDGKNYRCPKANCEMIYPSKEQMKTHIRKHFYRTVLAGSGGSGSSFGAMGSSLGSSSCSKSLDSTCSFDHDPDSPAAPGMVNGLVNGAKNGLGSPSMSIDGKHLLAPPPTFVNRKVSLAHGEHALSLDSGVDCMEAQKPQKMRTHLVKLNSFEEVRLHNHRPVSLDHARHLYPDSGAAGSSVNQEMASPLSDHSDGGSRSSLSSNSSPAEPLRATMIGSLRKQQIQAMQYNALKRKSFDEAATRRMADTPTTGGGAHTAHWAVRPSTSLDLGQQRGPHVETHSKLAPDAAQAAYNVLMEQRNAALLQHYSILLNGSQAQRMGGAATPTRRMYSPVGQPPMGGQASPLLQRQSPMSNASPSGGTGTAGGPRSGSRAAVTPPAISFSCPLCQHVLYSTEALSNHIVAHTQRPFICKVCDAGFTNDASLNNHLKSHQQMTSPKPVKGSPSDGAPVPSYTSNN